jgi:type II secretory pathway pseudopilin PulG
MSRGITKIEILIVIFLAVIIIAGDILLWMHLDKKARDINILSDINQIRSDLDVYLTINSYYPKISEAEALNDSYLGTEKLCVEGFKRINDNCLKVIQGSIPNTYLNEGNAYIYKSDGQNYQIQFTLSTNFPQFSLKKGVNCATNTTITSAACF